MDRNSIIGLFLIMLILVVFGIYNNPADKPGKKAADRSRPSQTTDTLSSAPVTDTVTIADNKAQADTPGMAPQPDTTGLFAAAMSGRDERIVLENEKLRITFSAKGGSPYEVELKQYKTHEGKPLVLFTGDGNDLGYRFYIDNKVLGTDRLFFSTNDKPAVIKGKDKAVIRFRAYASDSSCIEQTYTLHGNSYLVDYELRMPGMEKHIAQKDNFFWLLWNRRVPKQEKSLDNERMATTAYFRYLQDEEVDWLSEKDDEKEKLTAQVQWIAFKQQFFASALIAPEGLEDGEVFGKTPLSGKYVKDLGASFILPYGHDPAASYKMQLYFGPNHYRTLSSLEVGMERLVPLGWTLFRWVNKYFIIPIFGFLSSYIGNYGIIILILTLIIKIVISPLTYRSYLSTVKMSLLKPELDELRTKYKDDQQKFGAEQLKLFQRAGVNPLGGCLPILLQMPILIAMYNFFPSSIELRQEAFLWAKDLSTYDSIYNFPGGFAVPFYGSHVSLFTLLMTGSTILYTYLNSQMTSASNPQMKWMMYLMPVMFLGIFNNLASALTYYYFLFNILSFGQQYLIKKFVISEADLRKKIEERKNKPASKSRFQQKLEEMAKARRAGMRRQR